MNISATSSLSASFSSIDTSDRKSRPQPTKETEKTSFKNDHRGPRLVGSGESFKNDIAGMKPVADPGISDGGSFRNDIAGINLVA